MRRSLYLTLMCLTLMCHPGMGASLAASRSSAAEVQPSQVPAALMRMPKVFVGVMHDRIGVFSSRTGHRLRWLTHPRKDETDGFPSVTMVGGPGPAVVFVREWRLHRGCEAKLMRMPLAGGHAQWLAGGRGVAGMTTTADRESGDIAYSEDHCADDFRRLDVRVVNADFSQLLWAGVDQSTRASNWSPYLVVESLANRRLFIDIVNSHPGQGFLASVGPRNGVEDLTWGGNLNLHRCTSPQGVFVPTSKGPRLLVHAYHMDLQTECTYTVPPAAQRPHAVGPVRNLRHRADVEIAAVTAAGYEIGTKTFRSDRHGEEVDVVQIFERRHGVTRLLPAHLTPPGPLAISW